MATNVRNCDSSAVVLITHARVRYVHRGDIALLPHILLKLESRVCLTLRKNSDTPEAMNG